MDCSDEQNAITLTFAPQKQNFVEKYSCPPTRVIVFILFIYLKLQDTCKKFKNNDYRTINLSLVVAGYYVTIKPLIRNHRPIN